MTWEAVGMTLVEAEMEYTSKNTRAIVRGRLPPRCIILKASYPLQADGYLEFMNMRLVMLITFRVAQFS